MNIIQPKPYNYNKVKLGYSPPTQTPRCITSVERIKVAKFELTDSNVLKTSFPFGCPYKWYSQPQDSIKIFDPPCQYMAGLIDAKLQKKSNMLQAFEGKMSVSFNILYYHGALTTN